MLDLRSVAQPGHFNVLEGHAYAILIADLKEDHQRILVRSDSVLHPPTAALNLTTSSAGTRPRSFTAMPGALATRAPRRYSGCSVIRWRPLRAGWRESLATRPGAFS